MKATLTGQIQRVNSFQKKSGQGWEMRIKEEGQYGKTVEVSGDGVTDLKEGDTVTVVGEPAIRWQMFRAEIVGDEYPTTDDSDVPF